jgi:hypothetical protein
VRLEPAASAAPNRVPVVVEEAAYLGERVEYSVRTKSGRSFIVFSTRRDRHDIGAELDLVLDTTEATVWKP